MRNRTLLLPLLAAFTLSACVFGSGTPENNPFEPPDGPPNYSRGATLTLTLEQDRLAPGGGVSGVITFCAGVVYAFGAERWVFDAGTFRLSVSSDAERAVSVTSFPEGDTVTVPALGEPLYDTLPSPTDRSQRYCLTRRVRLLRSEDSPVFPVVGAQLFAHAMPIDPAQRQVSSGSVRVYEPGSAGPLPGITSCAVRSWTSQTPPGAELVSTLEFDAVGDSRGALTLVRSTGTRLLLDRRPGPADPWQRIELDTALPAQNVQMAFDDYMVARPRHVLAWRDTDFSRPRAEQSRVLLAWAELGQTPWRAETVALNSESYLRGLELAANQGEAVVGWVGDGGPGLRSVQLDTGVVTELPLPAELPADGVVRVLRLAADPVLRRLVLAMAVREADGVTRLRLWRRSGPGADWEALPVLEAGTPGAQLALGDLALSTYYGRVMLSWTWGQTAFFSSQARQQLQLRQWVAGRWLLPPDTSPLADEARRYALQPQGLQVAGCGDAMLMAWGEPAEYPRGAVFAAQTSEHVWNTFDRANLAPLPDGSGAFGGQVRVVQGEGGRPTLAVMLASPSGGPAPLVIRQSVP